MILVTGGAGFIGANFVLDWLRDSDEAVVNVDKLTYIGDVSLAESVDAVLRNGPITVHLHVGEAIAAGDDRRVLAAKAREAVEGALR